MKSVLEEYGVLIISSIVAFPIVKLGQYFYETLGTYVEAYVTSIM